MILNATAENVRGVFIPLFKKDFSINDTEIGFMLTVSSVGYIVFTYIGGLLCEKLGQKKVFIAGFISMVIALLGLWMSYSYPIFLISMFILNIGLSLISIAINTIIPVLFLSFQAVLMNLTHFCYGLGSTIIQRTSGILLFKGVSWRVIYLAEAVLFLAVFLFFLPVKLPNVHKTKNADNNVKKSELFKNKLLYFYMFALGFYVFAEMGTGNWFVNFIEKTYSYDKSKSSFYLALFFGIFTFGRLVGGFVAEKFGYIKTVLVSLIIALVLYITGINLGQSGLVIISISGLFFAVTFPTIVVTISKVFKENGAYATGIIVTISSTTNMVLNMVIGFLNDNIGVYKAFYLIPISLAVSILFVFAIYKNVKTIAN
ncbi:MFS transporter [Clostridium sp. YIM B02515]|uniref:MFS transporter n=1 Tax=Clostridium rhizosphaerae TaxID=2803861 RepID=A0ABS1TGD2_9CLOT|nr:MFS transporter [Clostridium rhizosphaerae]MBL4938444.1 MFS transporter [Clostridium rhizosphaerae]